MHEDRVLSDRTSQHDAEREMVFGWCRRLGLPLWSPPRAPEAIDALGREVKRLREALGMAVYHADNLQRFIDRKPVRDLAESRAGLEQARSALDEEDGNGRRADLP